MPDSTQHAPDDMTPATHFRRKRQLQLAALIIAVVVVVLWMASWLYHRFTHVTASDAQVAADVVTVSSRLPGRVTQFEMILGDTLMQGETIAQLYSRPKRLELAQIEAHIANIATQLRLTEQQIGGGIKLAKAMLAADTAAMHAAKTRMQKANENYQRAAELYRANATSEKKRNAYRYDFQAAHAEYNKTQSRVEQDRIAVTNARTGLLPGGKIGNPGVLRAELKHAKAKRAQQQNLIQDLTINSPIAGVVDNVFIDEGEYVSSGQPILMMHDPDNIWIEARIKETAIAQLEAGQPVNIHVDAWPKTTYKGHVEITGTAATNQFALLPNPNPSGNFTKITQRIPVRIAIDEGPLRKLAPGMMVVVDIDITDNN